MSKYVAECPNGHSAEHLQIRFPVDFQVTGVGGMENRGSGVDLWLEIDEVGIEIDYEADGRLGVYSGVWCRMCGEWYDQSKCVKEVRRWHE